MKNITKELDGRNAVICAQCGGIFEDGHLSMKDWLCPKCGFFLQWITPAGSWTGIIKQKKAHSET